MTTFSSHNRAENCWMQCRAQPRTYYMALIMLLVAYLFNIVAMPINRLATVTVTNHEKDTEWESYCAWNHLEHGATIAHKPEHSDYHNYCKEFTVFCEESKKGKIWLVMGVTAIFVGFFAWAGILRELRKDSKAITIIAMVLYSIICSVNVIVYLVQNGGTSQCAHNSCDFLNSIPDQHYHCTATWGLSLIFMLIAGVLAILSAIFTALISYDL
eukprot:UN06132